MFGRGIDKLGDLINIATDLDVVQKSGSWYSYGEERLGQGKEKAAEFLQEKPELIPEIRQKVIDAIKSGGEAESKRSKVSATSEDE